MDNFLKKNNLCANMMANTVIGKKLQATQKHCGAMVRLPPCPVRPQLLSSKRVEQNWRSRHGRRAEGWTRSAGAGTESLRTLQLAKA